jgi:predicted dinucleotide-binding enzyme
MKISVIGAGNVGGTLGKGFASKGHSVVFGVRDPESDKTRALLKDIGHGARAASVAEAAAGGEVVLLATPWPATREAIQMCGDLRGKVVIDSTNPVKPDLTGLELGHTTSAGEQVAAWAAGARVVKCFNTTGYPNMANPQYGENKATMFYCGDDPAAKKIVAKLAEDIGFETVDAGPLVNARLLESCAMLWIYLAIKQGMGVNFVYKLLKR